MAFNDINEVKQTLTILEKLYNNNKYIYSPFTIKDNTIVFTADSYYDPVLSLLTLKEYGIIDFTIKNKSSEADEITITDCRIDAFKMISERSPSYKNIEKLCEEQKRLSNSIDRKSVKATKMTFFTSSNKQDASIENDASDSIRSVVRAR